MSDTIVDPARLGMDLLGEEAPVAPPPSPLNSTGAAVPMQPIPIVIEQRRTVQQRAPKDPDDKAPASLRKIMGNAYKIRIWKVDDRGHEAYIGDYDIDELEKAGSDVEVFIQRYLVDGYGEGRYLVEGRNEKGSATFGPKEYTIYARDRRTPQTAATAASLGADKSIFDNVWKRMTELEGQLRANQGQVKTPVDMAEDYEKLKKIFGGNESSAMMFMLQSMMQQTQQPQVVAELASLKAQLEAAIKAPPPMAPLPALPPMAPPPDPMIGVVKLLETLKPPPPPPPADPLALVQTVMTMLSPMLEAIKAPKGPDPVVEILRDQVSSLRDELRDARSSQRTLKDTLEEINLLEQYTGGKRGNTPDSFWEFLGRFFDNFASNTDALSEMLTRVKREESAKRLPEGEPQAEGDAEDGSSFPVPDEFKAKIAELDAAKSNEKRIEIVMRSLYALGQDAHWRKEVMQLIALAKQGKKDEVLGMLAGLLTDCASNEFIKQASADDTVKAFSDHFEAVVAFLTKATDENKEKGNADKPSVDPS